MDEFEFDRDKLSKQLMQAYSREEELERKELSRKLKYLFTAVVASIVTFASYAWYSDGIAVSSNDIQNIPLVRADLSPVKIIPKDPGGMEIPNMDKSVYNNLADGGGEGISADLPKVERILPPLEEPVRRVHIATMDKRSTKNTDETQSLQIIERTSANSSFTEAEILEDEAEIEEPANTVVSLRDITREDIKPVPKPSSAIKQASLPPKKADAVKEGYTIQLGAYRSNMEATQNWNLIKGKFKELLSEFDYSIEKADLKEKGIFFRLRAGPVGDKEQAKKLCQSLIDKKQGCFVVLR